jgi:hypothetical protein
MRNGLEGLGQVMSALDRTAQTVGARLHEQGQQLADLRNELSRSDVRRFSNEIGELDHLRERLQALANELENQE